MRTSRLFVSVTAFVVICVLAVATAQMRAIDLVSPTPNSPPVAVDDHYTVHGFLSVSGNSVITNDYDPDGDSIHLESCGQAAHGTVQCFYQYQAFNYSPNNPYVGSDSFTYQVCDSTGACARAPSISTL
jgi:hypothetical protein